MFIIELTLPTNLVKEVGIEDRKQLFFLAKRVPGQGPEQRESEKTVLYPQIIVILISYYYILLLNY
jgi:hypothetical protein